MVFDLSFVCIWLRFVNRTGLVLFLSLVFTMATTGDFGPAPEGMDLTATQVPSIYASIIITAVLGTLSVLARFYARILLRNPIGSVVVDFFHTKQLLNIAAELTTG